jgi:hypothetical protein
MSRLARHLPSPARIVAVLALIAAMAGTAIAAGGNPDAAQDKKVFKKVVKKQAPKLSVKSAKKANNATSAATATSAAHAAAAANLGGLPASGYEQGAKFFRFAFTLPFGGERVLGTSGPLTLTAKCLQNATDNNANNNRDIARVVISTTQDGALFDGADTKRGVNAGDFLDTNTPETDRVFAEQSVATGTIRYDASGSGDGGARAADGSQIGLAQDATGYGVNLFGAGCAFDGFGIAGP